ncbi:GspH/FimT family pseudopilin [Fluoribacter gormanii]|uniref:GspH/FimT family pseudopilin n=1 Tax=Fluoribacter gormanii TaxID=464 RepID=UPI0013EF9D4F|nr:GspH/FimT family pseudopilin [Fluoribacter gormanii]
MAVQRISANKLRGFSLFEIMITIAILVIVMGIAFPSYTNFMNQKRVRTGTEELYNYIKIAQSEALTTKNTLYLSFRPANWCYGLSDTAPCDCTVVNSCLVNGIQTIVQSSDYSGNPVTLSIIGFSGSASAPSIIFDGFHGTITSGGSITVTLSDKSATINANSMGLVTVCSNTVSGYQTCP